MNTKKVLIPILALVLALVLALPVVSQAAITIYDKDQLGWETAVVTWETEDFTDATLNPGVSVVTVNGYVNTTNGVWWDKLDCPAGTNTTTWQFDRPIFAYGGTWNPGVPGGPGANIDVAINGGWVNVGEIPGTYINESWGFTSTVPFSQVRLQAGSNCYPVGTAVCERYELDDMVYASVLSVTKELVDALEDPATSNSDGIIDLGEKWYFNLSITVTNNFDSPIDNVMVKDNLGGDLELNDYGVSVGAFDSWTTGKTEKVHLTWEDIGKLDPGDEQTMWLLVSTDINTGTGNDKKIGHQEYTTGGTHCLNSGATAKGLVELNGVVWEVTDTTEEICVVTGEEPPIIP